MPTDKTPNVPATPEPAEPAGQPGAGARPGHQAGAAAMIIDEPLTYAEEQWDQIKTVFRDELGLDADQIERQITPLRIGDFEESITAMQSLRDRIAAAAGKYPLHSATKRQSLRRDELVALRKSAEGLRDSIIGAIAVPLGHQGFIAELLLPGVDVDMPTATSNYFRKLFHNLDRMIEQRRCARSHWIRRGQRCHCYDVLAENLCRSR